MKIKLSHHYWQDRKNAIWNPPQFPYPQIEQEIKQAYPLLEAERPKYKTFGNIAVFFDYRPTKDAYGRDIVPISFAFLQDCVNPKLCAKAIIPLLAQMPTSAQNMEVKLPDGCIQVKSRKPYLLTLLFGLVIVLLVSAYLFAPKEEQARVPTLPEILAEQQEVENILPKSVQLEKKSHQQSIEPEEVKTSSLNSDICDSDEIWSKLFPCPRAFLQAYCVGNLGTRQTFNNFRDANNYECGNWNYSGMDNISSKDLTSKERKQLRTIFK